jgi:hypothetical protein
MVWCPKCKCPTPGVKIFDEKNWKVKRICGQCGHSPVYDKKPKGESNT